VAGSVVTADTPPRELVNLILGQELQEMAEIEQQVQTGEVVLEVRGLTTRWLHDVSFQLHPGEVLGLTGLVGSGYEDAVYAIFGAIPAESGSLVVGGEERAVTAMTPQSAMAHGIALVPGDRQNSGSIPTLPASDNINLLVLDRYFRAGRLRQGDLDANAKALMDEFDVRPARPDLDYGSFSGGNQQKAMMAKWKQINAAVMLLHEPTQGVDVGARQQIWSMIRTSTDTTSTICASSDHEQLAAICDRVGVIARGRLVGYLTGAELTKERITDYCLSSSADASVAGMDGSRG